MAFFGFQLSHAFCKLIRHLVELACELANFVRLALFHSLR
jgi:hypothetical protein